MVDFNTAYREAVEKETQIRDTAFLPEVPWRVLGISLRWITPLDLKILDDAGNAVIDESITETDVPLAHVAAFFWFMAADHDPKRRGFLALVRKRILVLQIAKAGAIRYVLEARRFYRENMQDAPANSDGHARAMTTSWLVIMCDILAKEYGWDDDAIIRKPVARLFQYLNRIHERADPEAPRFNPSDSVKNRLMRPN